MINMNQFRANTSSLNNNVNLPADFFQFQTVENKIHLSQQ